MLRIQGPENLIGMAQEERLVIVQLSKDEAYEILTRCLRSDDQDTPLFRSALRRFARAIESCTHADEKKAG